MGLSAVSKAKKVIETVKEVAEAGIQKINGRNPINAKYAKPGIKPLDDFSPEQLADIRKVDPNFKGQKWKQNGHPDFTDHAFEFKGRKDFVLEGLKGNDHMRNDQVALIKELLNSGMKDGDIVQLFKTHTLHHVEDRKTVQMIPKAIHDASRHTGGSAGMRAEQKGILAVATVAASSILIPNSADAHQNGGNRYSAAVKDVVDFVDPGLQIYRDAEHYARDHDILGSIENFLVNGTFKTPQPLR